MTASKGVLDLRKSSDPDSIVTSGGSIRERGHLLVSAFWHSTRGGVAGVTIGDDRERDRQTHDDDGAAAATNNK